MIESRVCESAKGWFQKAPKISNDTSTRNALINLICVHISDYRGKGRFAIIFGLPNRVFKRRCSRSDFEPPAYFLQLDSISRLVLPPSCLTVQMLNFSASSVTPFRPSTPLESGTASSAMRTNPSKSTYTYG